MKIFKISVLAIIAISLLAACEQSAPPVPLTPTAEFRVELGTDPHSFAEYEQVQVSHLSLDLDADMAARTLSGHVLLDLERPDQDHKRLVLDSRDLEIRDVTVVGPDGDFRPVSWRLGPAQEPEQAHLGRPLVIILPQGISQVRVDYQTSPDAFGLQWLDANQTSSGKPFMFSQSQPHYARTWVPLQDTPAVRYTFDATIRAPRDLKVVMGAGGNPVERNNSGEYQFNMPQPVPSYLMAIAIGDLVFEELGPRSGVYAEPDWIERAAAEFYQLEEMIDIGEALYGPYRWGRYDLLVLPPSFPFGGMENPRLSYVTPTIIAGDGSLLALVAHELAHSWSGNLVTNSSWQDLWLNEGFTVYFESRIMEQIYSPEIVAMLAKLDWDSLNASLPDLDEADRQLVRDLSGKDPEGAFISVPYDMGRFFIDWLESRVGREDLDVFLRQYFDAFAFESIDTQTFRDYLNTTLIQTHPDALTLEEVDAWLYQPGMPATAVAPQSDALAQVDAMREAWRGGERALDDLPTTTWSVYEWLHFLSGIEGPMTLETMAELDAEFNLTASSNVEILYLWLRHSIDSEYEPGVVRLERFLIEVGRNKFTRPLYIALNDSSWGREWAVEVFERASPGYHPLTRQAAERALGLGSES